MRIGARIAGLALVAALAAIPAHARQEAPTARDYARLLQEASPKPGARSPAVESCPYAQDGECDEPGIGTGVCEAGTDRSDCWRLAEGREDDSCRWANDGECDEPGFGTGACTQGTDASDCGDVAHLRFTVDSCDLAFNGTCDEAEGGGGPCEARTDRSDCVGRERPLTITDHFFGRDDRVLMDAGRPPWTAVGRFRPASGGLCTATLIARDIAATAAHCIDENAKPGESGWFIADSDRQDEPRRARVIAVLHDPDWDEARFSDTDEIDGTDWALLRLDAPLGDGLGIVGPMDAAAELGEAALDLRVRQAGYSWDTGDNLSGNENCRVLAFHGDGTFSHDCDTTRGDSGSPFLVEHEGEWRLIGTDSNFRSAKGGPFDYIAADTSRWIGRLAGFAAGPEASATTGAQPESSGKPVARQPVKPGQP